MFCEGSVAIGMVRWSGRSLGFAKCGDYRGNYSGEDADAEEHEGDCGELTDNRYRVMVAVAHGGDSNKRPVEGVGKGTNVCAVRVLLHGCYDSGGKQDDSNAVCKQGFKSYQMSPSGDVAHDEQNGCEDSQRAKDRNEYQQRFVPVVAQIAQFAWGKGELNDEGDGEERPDCDFEGGVDALLSWG